MLILKYFLSVGTALTVGLIALSAHMESGKASSGPRTHTTASLPVATPPKPAVAAVSLIDEQIAPAGQTSKKSTRQSSSPQRERRSVH